MLAVPAPVQGQRLLTPIPQATASATVGDPSFGPEIAALAVQVDLELLRTEPGRLELPTPDGRVLAAELSVFEDRGGGDLMWSGGPPDAGYDSVVLTLEGGRLVGWFGGAGGVKYRISGRPDGNGRMEAGFNQPGRQPHAFCAVGSDRDRHVPVAPVRMAGAGAHDPPTRVVAPQTHDTLDILVVYTPTAALNWAGRGGAQAAIRNAGDYLNMVLRNARIDVRANIVHLAQIAGLDRLGRDGTGPYGSSLLRQLRFHGEAARLRREYRADLVHLFTGESPALHGACGLHYLLVRDVTAEDFSEAAYGWTNNYCGIDAAIFAHEVGHGLGALHEPGNNPGYGELAVRRYAFGHGNLDRIPNVGTIMSYTGYGAPYLSSVRIRPKGRVIGIAGERENERALRETIRTGVRYSDSLVPLPPDAPAAPTDLRVEMADDVSVRLSWRDNASNGYEVTFWRPEQAGEPNTRRLDDRRRLVLDLPVTSAGTRYFFFVRAVKGETFSARSSIVTLVIPGAEPAAPSGLVWRPVAEEDPSRMGTNSVRVTWVDEPDDEHEFEVQLLSGDGFLLRRTLVSSNSTVIPYLAPGGSYAVRVYAHGPGGLSGSSELLTIDSPPTHGPRAVSDLRHSYIYATPVRLTWTDNSSDELGFRVLVLVSGWYGLFEADANSESIEIEGLALGGNYSFGVFPYNDEGLGGGSWTYLNWLWSHVQRGPAAPTELRWGVNNGVARLTWKDNSSGETGFEVQWHPEYDTHDTTVVGGGRWTRVALVPADATSFELARSEAVDYRVFAYGTDGFSRASNTVRGMPTTRGDPPPGGDGGLTAAPSGETAVELTWTGRWARAVRGRLAVEARSPARSWTEVAMAEATAAGTLVTGLEPETPYTFRLRAAAADYSPEVSVTTGAFQGACREGSAYLCLRHERFEVRAHWSKPDAPDEHGSGAAMPVDISDESGLFWFFEPENIELVVKVLDGRTINGNYWVFFGALSDVEYWITVRDAETGERRTYHNPPREVCGQKDLVAFSDARTATVPASGAGPVAGRPGLDLLRMNAAALDLNGLDLASHSGGHCGGSEERLCVLDDRFSVEVEFVDPNAGTDAEQAAQVIPSLTTGKTGFFWFFSSSNIELAVKVLDGRALNGKFWFLYGGLSDVEYTITVTDTVTGSVRTYRNEAGSICGRIDIEAV